MKKFLFSIILITTLASSFVYAEEIKQSKDTNKTMSNDEFMKRFMALEQREKDAKAKTGELKKLNKTLDEALDLVNTKK